MILKLIWMLELINYFHAKFQINTPETGDPLQEGVDASTCGGLLDGVGGWPTCQTVHHGEHVSVAANRRQRSHQVDVDV